MDDPLDYVDFADVAVHGNPGKWIFQGRKQGSPTPATSPNAPPDTMKHYDLYVDEFGDEIELHYFRYTDGTVDDVKVRPRS
jgi:hypothetical protein